MEIQRAMLAANLKSSQEALAFLGRMQSLENSREAYKKSKQRKIQKISRGGSREAETEEEVMATARHRERLGMCVTDTSKVTVDLRTGSARHIADTTIKLIEETHSRHAN